MPSVSKESLFSITGMDEHSPSSLMLCQWNLKEECGFYWRYSYKVGGQPIGVWLSLTRLSNIQLETVKVQPHLDANMFHRLVGVKIGKGNMLSGTQSFFKYIFTRGKIYIPPLNIESIIQLAVNKVLLIRESKPKTNENLTNNGLSLMWFE